MNAQATATSLAALTEKAVGYARDMVLIWRRHPEVFPENAQADIRIADHISKISAEKAIPAGEAMTEDWLAGIIREQPFILNYTPTGFQPDSASIATLCREAIRAHLVVDTRKAAEATLAETAPEAETAPGL